MKTKYWVILLCVLFLVFAGLSLWLFLPKGAESYAEIRSEGQLVKTVDLRIDQSFTVESSRGTNIVTVKDGKIAVTEASCPDHYCVKRGLCDSGPDIICLPNQLVIHFVGEQPLDATAG